MQDSFLRRVSDSPTAFHVWILLDSSKFKIDRDENWR